MKFKHFVIIRFSIGNLGVAFFADRIETFKHITYPSLRAQTNQNFKCLLCVDDVSDKEQVTKLESLVDSKQYEIVFLENQRARHDFENGQPKRLIQERIGSEEYLITSRVDSDNAFANHYIEIVQNNFLDVNKSYRVEFSCGLCWVWGRVGFRKNYWLDGFSSLVSLTDNFDHIYDGSHTDLDKKFPLGISVCEDIPSWLIVGHSGCVSVETYKKYPNSRQWTGELRPDLLEKYFTVDIDFLRSLK